MFKALQSFRGIAAILVMVSHIHINSFSDRIYHSTGPSGVAYFLLLSGFVMCVAYEHALTSGTFEYREYLKRRIIRILPMHWLGLIFATIPVIILQTFDLRLFLVNIFALQAWHPSFEFGINVPSWCLAPIFLFYLLFPLLFKTMRRNPQGFLFSTVAFALLLLAVNLYLPDEEDSIWYTRYFPPARLFDFMVGMLLWLGYKRASAANLFGDMSYRRRSAVEIAVLAFWIVVAVIVAGFEDDSIWFHHGAWMLPSALIVFFFALFNEKGGVISRILSWRPLVYLGDISLTIYLLHYACPAGAHLGLRKFVGHHVQPYDPWTIAAGVALVFVVSILADRYFDRPVGRYLKRTFTTRRLTASASPR